MAEEFVRTVQFDEFSRRIGERFVGLETKMEQSLAHAQKEREQNFVHLNQRLDDLKESVIQRLDEVNRGTNQRFDSLERRMDQFHADTLQMRNWLVRLYALVAFGFIGAIALILLKDVIFK